MRTDASLDALLADALTSDYANAPAGQDSAGRFRIFIVAGAATLVTLVLGMAIAQTQIQASENSITRDALVERVKAADRRVQVLEATVLTAQDNLLNAEAAVLAGTSLGDQARSRLDRLRIATGQTEVVGNGVTVTIDDAPLDPLVTDTPPGRVIDRDLQMIVNGLWQAGATDIAINGRRITPTSAIRAAGEAILVNYRPMSPPYVVSAIGPDADRLAGRFRDNPAGLLLEELEAKYGVIWELQRVGNITLPAASSTSKNSEDAS
jgi:uncharacterized protein YlxW (UPF0749 family)